MKKSRSTDPQRSAKARLDDAARAGWLYYVAGITQDEIARRLNVSRPTAQRLVSLALSERLITFRLDHPVAACMELAARLTERYDLHYCDVMPADERSDSEVVGIAEAAAAFLEQKLAAPEPIVIAVGTGRTLRAAVEQVPRMTRRQHKLVSLVGHISMEGAGSFYDVLARLSDLTLAPHFPMPLPVVVSSRDERDQLIRTRAGSPPARSGGGGRRDAGRYRPHGRERAAADGRLHLRRRTRRRCTGSARSARSSAGASTPPAGSSPAASTSG